MTPQLHLAQPRRVLAAWLAVFIAVFGALAPTVSHALVWSRGGTSALTEVCISGATVGKDEIEHLQLVNNLLELGKRVPGISMVRNMRIPDGDKLYTENRIDGMCAVSTNTSVFDEADMANIDRIDVITGPASRQRTLLPNCRKKLAAMVLHAPRPTLAPRPPMSAGLLILVGVSQISRVF